MDITDYKIIEILQNEGRISMKDLGKIVGLPSPAVSERVKRLEEAGVIEGYKAIINPNALGRVIKAHNLLQTLTRVNRPYKNFKYGYVVDFADIREEFDRTNAAYFNELQQQLGEDFKTYSNIFLSQEEIEKSIKDIENKLFEYDSENLEIFSQQINALEKKNLIDLKKIMITYKDIYNVIKQH